jgi:hypothetical protein
VAEHAAPDDDSGGHSPNWWSGDEELPDSPMPDDVHGAGLAEADADDDQYGVVIRD